MFNKQKSYLVKHSHTNCFNYLLLPWGAFFTNIYITNFCHANSMSCYGSVQLTRFLARIWAIKLWFYLFSEVIRTIVSHSIFDRIRKLMRVWKLYSSNMALVFPSLFFFLHCKLMKASRNIYIAWSYMSPATHSLHRFPC